MLNVFALAPMAIDTDGILTWAVQTIIPIAFLIIGCFIIFGASKGKASHAANTLAVALLGVILIAGGAAFYLFGEELVDIIFT